MDLPPYPLEQLAAIKKRRFDDAVKTLEAKKAILEKAYEKLYDVTQEYNKVLEHKTAKLEQLRTAMDEGTPSSKIVQMKFYLKTVDEKLVEKKKKVVEQQKVVDAAQDAVDAATDDLFRKKKEMEKIELHQQEWRKEVGQQIRRKETVEHDEQGAATHEILKKRRHKNRTEDIMTNKVGGPSDPTRRPPEFNTNEPRKVEAVEKVGETDPDQQAKQNRFREYMEDDFSKQDSSQNSPSPFDPAFHREQEGYNYSPIEEEHKPHLPSSQAFLHGPSDVNHPDHAPHLVEKKGGKKQGKVKGEYPLFVKLEGVAAEAKTKEKEAPKGKSDGKGVMIPGETRKERWTPFEAPPPETKKNKSEAKIGSGPRMPVPEITSPKEKSKRDSRGKSEELSQPVPTLPHEAALFAESAAVQGARYLAPETAILYVTMVGNIYVYEQTDAGIARTEIVLNSPSFAGSRFFGATITLEKYDTDPSSFNIRLTGSNEAVTTFNQNIKNLYAAFQNGGFRFRIGRLEADYSVEKPLFHRKESGKGKDAGGNSKGSK